MPTSEFRCSRCGRQFRRIFFQGEEPKAVACPYCGHPVTVKAPQAERLFDGIADGSTLAKDTN